MDDLELSRKVIKKLLTELNEAHIMGDAMMDIYRPNWLEDFCSHKDHQLYDDIFYLLSDKDESLPFSSTKAETGPLP